MPTGADGLGPPAGPPWVMAELTARGGRLSTVTVRESKWRHGRCEERMLAALADPALDAYAGSSGDIGTPWPAVAQVCRLERRRTLRQAGVLQTSVAVTYLITSRSAAQADAAALLARDRGQWGIENKVHYVRDVTFGEDASLIHAGQGPTIMALLRDAAVSLLHQAGIRQVAARLRTHSQHPEQAVALVVGPLLTHA